MCGISHPHWVTNTDSKDNNAKCVSRATTSQTTSALKKKTKKLYLTSVGVYTYVESCSNTRGLYHAQLNRIYHLLHTKLHSRLVTLQELWETNRQLNTHAAQSTHKVLNNKPIPQLKDKLQNHRKHALLHRSNNNHMGFADYADEIAKNVILIVAVCF